jgi:hypothetical protein
MLLPYCFRVLFALALVWVCVGPACAVSPLSRVGRVARAVVPRCRVSVAVPRSASGCSAFLCFLRLSGLLIKSYYINVRLGDR